MLFCNPSCLEVGFNFDWAAPLALAYIMTKTRSPAIRNIMTELIRDSISENRIQTCFPFYLLVGEHATLQPRVPHVFNNPHMFHNQLVMTLTNSYSYSYNTPFPPKTNLPRTESPGSERNERAHHKTLKSNKSIHYKNLPPTAPEKQSLPKPHAKHRIPAQPQPDLPPRAASA